MKKQILILGLAALTLAACGGGGGQKGPSYTLKTETREAGAASSVSKMTFGELVAVAAKSNRMSCLELLFGGLQSGVLKNAAKSRIVQADDLTKRLAASIGGPVDQRIRAEQNCHCDGLNPMPGYEVFERRQHLLNVGRKSEIKPEYAALYPRNDAGQPRYLAPGEDIDDSILAQLPPIPRVDSKDDCGWSCKAARKRTNAKAVAEGKPEPWPNLKRPPKAQCTPAEKAALQNG